MTRRIQRTLFGLFAVTAAAVYSQPALNVTPVWQFNTKG